MASTSDWAAGYLAQARADLNAARILGAQEPSVLAMLLQMTFEKLAKAALLRSRAISIAKACSSHKAASQMMRVLKRQRRGPTGDWQQAFRVVTELEQAHPALAAGAQLEYPWEGPGGEIRWPADHLSIAAELGSPKKRLGAQILQFARRLSDEFDQVFPA